MGMIPMFGSCELDAWCLSGINISETTEPISTKVSLNQQTASSLKHLMY
jgi:hypothetical protein